MANLDIVNKTSIDERDEFLGYYLGDTPEEAEETFEEFSALLNRIAGSHARLTGLSKEDLFGTALTGLAKAKRDFDPSRSDNFKSFAMFKIKSALNKFYRKNKTIVSIPAYVKIANNYISAIKFVLRECNAKDVQEMLYNGHLKGGLAITNADVEACRKYFRQLKKLAKNVKVPYQRLVDRSEYVPSEVVFCDDGEVTQEWFARERELLAAAILVSKLKDRMTDDELYVAEGIMDGKSYVEIGGSHHPRRSVAWVRLQLDYMKAKFEKEVT